MLEAAIKIGLAHLVTFTRQTYIWVSDWTLWIAIEERFTLFAMRTLCIVHTLVTNTARHFTFKNSCYTTNNKTPRGHRLRLSASIRLLA